LHGLATRWRNAGAVQKIPKILPAATPKFGADPNSKKNAKWAIKTPTNPERFAKNLRPFWKYEIPKI